jgi:hypothetical protein
VGATAGLLPDASLTPPRRWRVELRVGVLALLCEPLPAGGECAVEYALQWAHRVTTCAASGSESWLRPIGIT